jgi:hypothetical protein
VIRAEFFVGAAGCLALGVLTFLAAEGWGRALGVWLIGIGANYVPLAVHAVRLSRRGGLEAELVGVDLRSEARRVRHRPALDPRPVRARRVGRPRTRRMRQLGLVHGTGRGDRSVRPANHCDFDSFVLVGPDEAIWYAAYPAATAYDRTRSLGSIR